MFLKIILLLVELYVYWLFLAGTTYLPDIPLITLFTSAAPFYHLLKTITIKNVKVVKI